MDRFDAVTAAEFVGADTVIPIHYGTFPPVETDAQAFKSDVQNAGFSEVVLLEPGRDAHDPVTHAIVLIEAERTAMPTLGGELADVEGVAEAYSVTGEWDFVAIIRVREPEQLAPLVTGRLAQIDGHQAHAHDGRLRGLLPARPRGAVLDRELGTQSCQPRANQTERSFQSCAISSPPAATSPASGRSRRPIRATMPAVASSAPVAP